MTYLDWVVCAFSGAVAGLVLLHVITAARLAGVRRAQQSELLRLRMLVDSLDRRAAVRAGRRRRS